MKLLFILMLRSSLVLQPEQCETFCVVFQVCYAKELKEGFVEYTEQVVKLMVPLLKFYFHDDILWLYIVAV